MITTLHGSKIALRIYVIFVLSVCLALFYSMFFQRQFKQHKVINDIVSLHIQSQDIEIYPDEKRFKFLVGDPIQGSKYSIIVIKKLPQPFKTTDRCEVFIKNFDGDIVFSYDTKFTSFSRTWKSDYIKLIKYLNIW